MKGHIRRRGERSWAIVLDIGPDETGRRRQKWHTVHGTKKQAEAEMAKLLHDLNRGAYVEPSRVTVADWLRQWLATRETAGRAPSTILRYRQIIDTRIVPRLGRLALADLRASHLDAHYARELRAPRADGRPGTLSRRSVYFEHQVLHAALDAAVRQGILARNPADAVTPPRPSAGEQSALTPAQVAALLDGLRGHRLAALYSLALSTGMRQGELIGLRWSDVDLDAGRLFVRVQQQYLPRQGTHERPTKEHRGDRPIELTAEEVDALRQQRATQAEERLRLGPIWRDQGLVFPSEVGTPLSARNLYRLHVALMARLGLPPIRFHDLRHTAGTLLMREDGRVVVAQRRLGHAKASTTMDLYGHALPGDQREAAGKVQAAIEQARLQNVCRAQKSARPKSDANH